MLGQMKGGREQQGGGEEVRWWQYRFGACENVQMEDWHCVGQHSSGLDDIHEWLRDSDVLDHSHVNTIDIIPKVNLQTAPNNSTNGQSIP